MIWGCICARGVDNIHSIDNIMIKYVHNDILKKVKQSIIRMGMSYIYMFQQENSSKHNAVLIWNIPKQLKAPAQSLDIKPIEHLWVILKRGVHKVSIKSKNHFGRVVIQEWEAISSEICRNLVNSMHRRSVSVIRARGYANKYWNLKCLMYVFSF